MSSGELHLRFPQINAEARPAADCEDCRALSVRLSCGGRVLFSADIGLHGRALLTSRSSCTAPYEAAAGLALELLLSEAPPGRRRADLARLDIPLDWLPPGLVVRESFRMRALAKLAPPLLFLEAHRLEGGGEPWFAPLGQILPRSQIPPTFDEGFQSAEFARPDALRFAPSEEERPPPPAIHVFEEEEEEIVEDAAQGPGGSGALRQSLGEDRRPILAPEFSFFPTHEEAALPWLPPPPLAVTIDLLD
jgi:hypothetical protein